MIQTDMPDLEVEKDILEKLNTLGGGFQLLEELVEEFMPLPQQGISQLKKRIKYCKNPMEKKMLQKELEFLYKEQKRK